MEQTGKVTLVTGASRGLGAALALLKAQQGDHVIAVARTTGGLEALDDKIKQAGGQATLAPMDITNENAMRHLCRSIYDQWGKVDCWIHAACYTPPLSPVTHMDQKAWRRVVDHNIYATGCLITFVEPLLRAASSGATAVFFEDTHIQDKFFGPYGAGKAAQIALIRAWQAESVTTGIRVVLAAPQPIASGVRARFYPGEDKSKLATSQDEAHRLVATYHL